MTDHMEGGAWRMVRVIKASEALDWKPLDPLCVDEFRVQPASAQETLVSMPNPIPAM
jgi:hypothetical protein